MVRAENLNLKLVRTSPRTVIGALAALLLVASCNQILGNQQPSSDGMGGAGAPSDSGGTSGSGGDEGDGPCAHGTFDHDSNPDTVCDSWSKCQPGQYVFEEGTPTTDRSCKACGTGTFSDVQNATECAEWVDCEPGEYVDAAGTKEDDRQCEACPEEEYSAEDNADECEAWTDCGHPWKYAEMPNSTADAECGAAIRQFGSPVGDDAARVAIDADGNVYVAGHTAGAIVGESAGSSDGYVRKFDAHGALAWEEQFGSTGQDKVHDVAVDAAGNVYIVGETSGTLPGGTSTGGEDDAYVIKYGADGVRQATWQFRPITDNTRNAATSVAVDGEGNVYVAGTTWGGPTEEGVYLCKYDSTGTPVWTATDTVDQADTTSFMDPRTAVDQYGTAYLAWHKGFPGGLSDNAVARYTSSSTPDWTTHLNNLAADLFAPSLGVAAHDDSVYVVGYTTGGLNGDTFGGEDAYIIKYDALGAQDWSHQFGGVEDDRVEDVAVDASGAVFVVGVTENDFVGTNQGGNDGFLRKYSLSGVEAWTQQWGTPSADNALGVAPDGEGNAFVAGSTAGELAAENPSGWPDFYVMLVEPP